VTGLVTERDIGPDGEATATSNNGPLTIGGRSPQLARARDAAEPTRGPGDGATPDADSDALRGFYAAAGRAEGALRDGRAKAGRGVRMAFAGPRGWPVITRRNPSVLEVFSAGRDSRAWDSPSLLVRWPARGAIIAEALWETGCMTARVWFRTRITWAVTILIFVAYLVWGH
jgi:hypothetical protein